MAMNRFGLIPLRAVLLALGLVLASAGTVKAGFKEGMEALQQGDFQSSIKFLTPLADKGHVMSAAVLGSVYADSATGFLDDGKAFQYTEIAAIAGFPAAQNGLGYMYLFGRGTSASTDRARHYFRLAADQGHVQAQLNYGQLLVDDNNENSTQIGLRYIEMAADRRLPGALNALGLASLSENGRKQNKRKAVAYFKEAVSLGDIAAHSNLADRYAEGDGVGKDPVKAFELYSVAALANVKHAQRAIGLAYASGSGVAEDPEQALVWLAISRWDPPDNPRLDITTADEAAAIAIANPTVVIRALERAKKCVRNGLSDCL